MNASFDAKNQRFFVSASASGLDNDFSITASDSAGDAALSLLGLKTKIGSGEGEDNATYKKYAELAAFYVEGDKSATLDKINADGRITNAINSRVNSYLEQYKSLLSSRDSAQGKINEINEKYKNSTLKSVEDYADELSKKQEAKTKLEEEIQGMEDGDDKTAKQAELDALNEEMSALAEKKTDAQTLASATKTVEDSTSQMKDLTDNYIDVTSTTDADGKVTYSATAKAALTAEVEDSYYNSVQYAAKVIADGSASGGATKVSGQDAEIVLNGATFTGNTNVFEINGLTFTALSTTAAGEEITVTTEDDVDGIYDMVKGFLKEYNTLINEMDKLYNADSAKGYEPLTDDEKDAMSDTEVENMSRRSRTHCFGGIAICQPSAPL